MTNGQRAGARRGMRGHDGVTAREIETGLRLTLGGSYQDVTITTNMTAEEVETAVKIACIQLANG
jgi:hypothetical protein